MSWWERFWKRPDTDGGCVARAHLAQVTEQQSHVNDLLARLERRRQANHFREAFEDSLRRDKD